MYYVYAYLDPRKPGTYHYDNLNFDYEPFYIGKGTKDRCYQHLSIAKKTDRGKHPFLDKIQKLTSLNLKPIIIKIYESLDNVESLVLEKVTIAKIGLRVNSGPLLNLTEGGSGGDTFSNKTKEEKQAICAKRAKSMTGKNKGKQCSVEQRKKISIALTGRKNPEHSARLTGRKLSEEVKNKIKRKPQPKTVIQLDMNDNVIKIWDSHIEAALYLNMTTYFDIIACCKNKRKTSHGYKWKFAT